ncbi:hypothetical protein DCAR_0830539 [Daucus carota subsp. sativus]|uniref:F-box domain-containing protein n=1 Tax=Daucus carota subsp. sativus TaxID=79200 RepID=A0A175YJP9_DAUCS|nr:PREDICTED: F-box/kelch-repeat protein At3g06240-like [Daucus carota subsp. sativus]WOH11060.1 hypothetical protein DCAR_0830539 [Daucus carota subsp. sativus]
MSTLPQEIIIEEILKRLPVESLVKLQVVCKLWNSLLHDPCFTRSHFQQSISQKPENDYLIINDHKYGGGRCPNVLSILSRNNFSETCIDKVPYSASESSNNDINLIGSINGLVCLNCFSNYRRRFMIWNPMIHRSKKILLPKYYGRALQNCVCGFGWDSITNDYKVMIKPGDSVEVALYSCKTDCWSYKPVDCDVSWSKYDIFQFPQFPSVVVKGIPYWKYYDGTKIVNFDVTTNRFRSLVNNNTDPMGPYYNLVNIYDALARIMYSNFTNMLLYVDLYDENRGVWSKMYEIKNVVTRSIKTLMCFKYGGETVYADRENVNCYDPKSDEIKVLVDCKKEYTQGFSYTPSLLSLDGMSSTSLWI